VFADPTTGAQNDIDRATTIARQMVTEYGMSAELGPLRLGQPRGEVFLGRDLAATPDYSDQVAARIDAEVRRLVEDARAVARRIIETNRAVLDQLAAELVERETIEVDRVTEIFASVEPYHGGGLGRPSAVAVSETNPGGTNR
jgi:cell division protease FtsH